MAEELSLLDGHGRGAQSPPNEIINRIYHVFILLLKNRPIPRPFNDSSNKID